MTRAPAAVEVRSASHAYPVLVGPGLLDALPRVAEERVGAHRYAVVADARVAELYGERVAEALGGAPLLSFPPGEASKTRETWAALTDALASAGVGRDGAVVALGGGVTGDLAGFVAATYLRGVPVVQVPTSLVAMVDSSVGGKTGVDVPAGKNLVGAFHPPRAVVADTATVTTLPPAERAQGLVEAVKHGAILDADYLERLEDDLDALLEGDVDATTAAVLRSVEIKSGVVERDEREGGLRQVLNFGHTLGHGLEAAAGWALPHGTAVGIGMVLEARLGEALGVTRRGTAERLARIVVRLGLPVRLAEPPGAEAVLGFVRADKKARGGRPRYVLLEAPGRVAADGGWSRPVPDEAVAEVLRGWLEEG